MAIETIPFKEIERRTKDIYEAAVVVAKRARQIIADRFVEYEMEEKEEELGLMDEPSEEEDYVEGEKPTTVALEEFLEGDLLWTYRQGEEESEEETE